MSGNTHWVTAHDPAKGFVEVIRAQPVVRQTEGSPLSNVWSLDSVPATSKDLSAGLIERPLFGETFPQKNSGVQVIFVDAPVGFKSEDKVTMHRTNTLDVDVCIFGEISHYLPSGEVITLKPGDSLVQRGTNHAWANLGSVPARMVCTVIQAEEGAIQVDGKSLSEYWDHEASLPQKSS